MLTYLPNEKLHRCSLLVALFAVMPMRIIQYTCLAHRDATHSPWLCSSELMTISIMADSDILQRFGERVRELRKECGWSQEELALECGLDRTYMGGIERGERNVALRNIEKIADALGLTIADLMAGV
jgi:ribosome-binding protein aMBF1 (putative translation factor)